MIIQHTVSDNTTLTAKSKADNIILGISTTNTTNSITVVASASATSGISKYEFSKDGGKTWVNGGTNKAYTFSGLTQGTSYNIQIRVTANSGKTSTTSKTVKTSSLTKPTFKEAATSTGKTVTITYPSGCGSTYTCTYQKDNGTAVTVKSTTASVAFTANGSVVAKVTDGTNSVSSSYNVTRIVAISVGSVRGGSSSLPKSKAVNGETITFTASPSSDFTYQGATVVCNNGVKYNVSNSSKSFSISNTACTSAVLYPTWKKNQKVVMNGATRDSTFSLTKYDTNATKPHFNSYSTFYAFESKNPNDIQDNYTIVSTRGQMTSSKKYNISDYSKLSIMISGSYFSGSGGRIVYFGLIRSNSTWVNTAASPDFRTERSLPSNDFANSWYDLNLNQKSNSNTYYVVVQYLSINNVSTLNVSSIIFEGQTYSYTNRGV